MTVHDGTTIRSVQQAAWTNKVGKGFNLTDVPLEFGLLHGELAEAFDAWRRGNDNLGEELADVLIFLVSLAQMNHIDLDAEVVAKMTKNAARTYVRTTGCAWEKIS